MKNRKTNALKLRSILAILAMTLVFGMALVGCDGDAGTKDVLVTGVTLNKNSLTLAVGGTETLTATVSPSDATNIAVTWSTSNAAVATVSNGTVTAVSAGSATITVTTVDGGRTATCSVTVVEAKSITITGLPATYQYGAIVLYAPGTTLADVANSRGAVAASDNIPGVSKANGSVTYPLLGLDDNRWTGSGTYDVMWLYNSASTGELKPYRVNSASFTSASTTVAFNRFIEITGSGNNMTYSLDGIWGTENGFRVTVSGSTGVFSALATPGGVWQSAIDKGYVKMGDQFWKSLTSTGNLTWSGQELVVLYRTSSPNVAIGTRYDNCTLTMSADGQTLTQPNGNVWTRKQ